MSSGKRRNRDRADSSERDSLYVLNPDGTRRLFLRGMITHDLIQRGLGFDQAYAVARAVRGHFSDRQEVTSSELRDRVARELERATGGRLTPAEKKPAPPGHGIRVSHGGDIAPFSRGLLARSVQAAGLDLDRAYQMVIALEGDLRTHKVDLIPSTEIARQIGDLLEEHEGGETARNYRLIRRIHRLPRPLVVYIGGASGTGKSTFALELAPLLRIYRVNASDTIRQVMRMVFTRSILPALHSSSFEVVEPYDFATQGDHFGSPRDPEFAKGLAATFEEQATRVCVGIRAVVERAIVENMNILVEGTHLHPARVPFADLEGAAYQVPLVLATLDEEVHRTRFLTRSRFGIRRAERYLENFSSIRFIHDHILQQAEAYDWPLLDTSDSDSAVGRGLRIVTSVLEQRLPKVGKSAIHDHESPTVPVLLIIIDGLADRAVRALGGRTPLQAAHTPALDRLAAEGQTGLADPVAPGVVPDTASGSLALFGQSPLALKRGPVEALGAGLQLSPGDIALRGNFATLDQDGRVLDRRAGRIRDDAPELAEAIDRLHLPGGVADDVEVRVKSGTEHRLAIVLRGSDLSSKIQGSDPGERATSSPPLTPRPLDPDDERAVHTARVLALFEQEARRVLAEHPINRARLKTGDPQANSILTRGAGRIHTLIPLEDAGLPLRISCISGDRTVLGLAHLLGADTTSLDGMTGNLDTDVKLKLATAKQALKSHELVIVHIKGADIAAHDRRPDLKAGFLEKIDRELMDFLKSHPDPIRIAVASDHATLSESGQHAADPLPVLIWGKGIEADSVKVYDEHSAGAGQLQRFPLQMLLGRLFQLS